MRRGFEVGLIGLVTGTVVAACGITLDAAPDDGTDSGTSLGGSTSSGAAGSGGPSSSSSSGTSGGSSTSSSGSTGSSTSSSSSGTSCEPITCAPTQCGTLPDTCGSTIECTCAAGQACTGGVCCAPQTAAEACGTRCLTTTSDGCGGTVDCGACPGGQVCTAQQTCCAPMNMQDACNGKCGAVSDGCGGTVNCPDTCNTQQKVCGGGGVANVCGCESAATTCAGNIDGKPVCKTAKNNCGQPMDCSANVCGQGKTCTTDCRSGDGGQYGCCTP